MPLVQWKETWKKRLEQLSPKKPEQFAVGQPVVLPPKPVKKKDPAKLFATIAFFCFLAVIGGAIIAGILLVILARDLPRPDRIVRKEGFATKIYDRNNKLIYDVFEDQKRTPVQLYQIPQFLKDATISIEDKEFYTHSGFDPRGYLRAVYTIIVKRRLQGGSTLTQQLVKNVLLSSERTVIRKIKEFVLTLEIESRYSKDQILQMYLNEAPYGGTAWGVEEASRTYFDKSVSELGLAESAILAGLPQRPSYYSPAGSYPTAYISRTTDVLRRMREDNKISTESEKEALDKLESVKFASKSGTLKAPHFVMYVKKLLEEKYGEKAVELGGLRVTTSLDLEFQEKAQKIVAEEIAKVEKLQITNGAAVVMDPKTGEILAMVGSKNYDDPNYDGKFNVVTALRQPGSAIKPVTYVTAIKKGYTASTLLMDTLTTFPVTGKPDYAPLNYDGKEHGPVQLRFALGSSLNIPAVKMLSQVGLKEMLSTSYEMGLSSLEPSRENLARLGLSVTLGGGEVKLIELASAYSAFANGGIKIEPVAVLKVTDNNGNVLDEFKNITGPKVLSEQEAFLISDILSDNNARLLTFGENNALKVADRQVAAKTGTTNDRRDNWTIGWTPQVMVGVWVGNNDNSPMKSLVSGVSGAAPIWRRVLTTYLQGKPREDFAAPAGIVSAEVDKISGYRSHDGFPARMEYFIEGTEPLSDDPVHPKIKICKSQGKLATEVDIARGDYEEKEYFIFKEKDPFAAEGGENRWQKGIDAWVAKQSDERYRPPSDYCNSVQVYVRFVSPADLSRVGTNFAVKVAPTSLNEIVKIEVFADGNSKKTFSGPPYELEMTLPDGTHTLKAVVTDSKGNQESQEVRIGVNVPWDYVPPTPTPLAPTVTPTSLPTATPTP